MGILKFMLISEIYTILKEYTTLFNTINKSKPRKQKPLQPWKMIPVEFSERITSAQSL